jgi:hypothetical protein
LVSLVEVDGVCINLFNLDEKSRQVQDILVIFQKAERVLSWIGIPLNPFSYPFDELKEYTQNKINMDIPVSEGCFKPDSLTEEVSHVVSRPWSRRTWFDRMY